MTDQQPISETAPRCWWLKPPSPLTDAFLDLLFSTNLADKLLNKEKKDMAKQLDAKVRKALVKL